MEFGLSQEQILLQDSVGKFLNDQVPLDKVRQIASGESSDAEVWQGLADLGIPSLLIAEEQGGVGLGSLDAVVIAECLGYHVTPSPFISSAVMAPIALMAAGRQDALAAIASGRHRVGIAFGEAIGARNDAGVVVDGTVLSGKCLFVLDADADAYLIATPEKNLYLIAADAKGVERNNLTTVDKTRTTCELILNNATSELVSDDPEVYLRTLDAGRVMQAADTLGAAQCMLDQAVAYAKQREQFNRVIASFQAVKHMCAEMVANLEPCRSMVWYAGHALDEVPEEARLIACHSKAHLSEVGKFVAKTATEVHGGMGFTDLVGLHYWFKRIGANRQLLGAPELVREEAARIQGLAV
ncbi:MAG: acyl-CoA/acyl-ACP dehydrogenase [Gammaproteobacteria bacterium]|nr:acyl-CoA/acyl-ACP dehydrogenase [Gammaproteobacteria bacterium]